MVNQLAFAGTDDRRSDSTTGGTNTKVVSMVLAFVYYLITSVSFAEFELLPLPLVACHTRKKRVVATLP